MNIEKFGVWLLDYSIRFLLIYELVTKFNNGFLMAFLIVLLFKFLSFSFKNNLQNSYFKVLIISGILIFIILSIQQYFAVNIGGIEGILKGFAVEALMFYGIKKSCDYIENSLKGEK